MTAVKVHRQRVEGPFAWRAADLERDRSWLYQLTATEVAEIDRAVLSVRKAGLKTLAVRSRDFPLPTLSARIREIWDQLENGRGMTIMRGLPVERYDPADAELVFWGIGSHLGICIPQNSKGDYIGRVEDSGAKWGELRHGEITRGYVTRAYLPFHSDTGDVASLLCVRAAKSGGYTSIVSSTSIFNAILESEPEALPALFRGFYYSLRGESGEGVSKVSTYPIPVFSFHEGRLNARYIRRTIETGARMGGMPLTDDERHALDVMDKHSKSEELCFSMMMEPGDLQYVQNFVVLHSRTEFEDYEEAQRKRLMLRLWLQVPHARALIREHETLFGETTPFPTRQQAIEKEARAAA